MCGCARVRACVCLCVSERVRVSGWEIYEYMYCMYMSMFHLSSNLRHFITYLHYEPSVTQGQLFKQSLTSSLLVNWLPYQA